MSNDAAIEIALKMVDQATAPMQEAFGIIDRQTGAIERSMNKLTGTVNVLYGAFAAYGGGQVVKGFFDTGIAMDRMEKSLSTATGSVEKAEEAERFLREESERLGLVFMDQVKGYQGISAAGKAWNLTSQETQDIYLGVAEAATAMQMKQEDVNGVFRAFSQIMSKGKLQAEEIRGQIGERLPGAFELAARSIGKNSEQLSEMLERGEVLSQEFIPKFAKQLREEFAGSLDASTRSAQANINRITNSWIDLQDTVMSAGVMGAFQEVLVDINVEVNDWLAANDALIAQQVPVYIDALAISFDGLGSAMKIALAGAAVYSLPGVLATSYVAASTAVNTLSLSVYSMGLALKAGTPLLTVLNTELYGTTIAATSAAGAMGKLSVASGVLFSAWAGWEIGSWLHDNFETARLTGIAFVDSMYKGWYYLQYGAEVAFLAIKTVWDEIIFDMKETYALFLDVTAKGLEYVPFADGAAASLHTFVEELRKGNKPVKDFKEQAGELGAELEKNLLVHGERINGLVDDVFSVDDPESLPNGLERTATAIGKVAGAVSAVDTTKIKEIYGPGRAEYAQQLEENAKLLEEQRALWDRLSLEALPDHERAIEEINRKYQEFDRQLTDLAGEGLISMEVAEKFDGMLAERMAEELADVEEANQAAADEVGTIWEGAFNRITDSLADMLYEFDFSFDAIVDMARRGASQYAAAMIMDPIQASFTGSVSGYGGSTSTPGTSVTGYTGFDSMFSNTAMSGLQESLAWGLSDLGFDTAAFAVDGMSSAMFGSLTAGFGTAALSLLSVEDIENAALSGVSAGIGFAVGGPIGAAIGGFVGDLVGGAIFGDDEPRSTRYAEVAEYDYNPVTGQVTTIGSYAPHISGYDARGTETSGSDFSDAVSSALTTMVSSMEALGEAAGLSEQAIRSGFDSVASIQASTDDRKYFDDPVSTGENLATSYYHRLKGDDVEEDFQAYWEQNMSGAMEGLFAPFVEAFTGMIGDGDLDLTNFSAEASGLLQSTFDDAISLIKIDPENDIESEMAEVEQGMNTLASVYSYIAGAADIIGAIDESIRIDGLSETALAMEEINTRYADMEAVLTSLGIAVEDTNLELAKQTEIRDLQKGILDGWIDELNEYGTDEFQKAFMDLETWKKEQYQVAADADLSTNFVDKLYDYKLEEIRDARDSAAQAEADELAAANAEVADSIAGLKESFQSLLDDNTLGDVALQIQDLTYWYEAQLVAISALEDEGADGASELRDLLVEPLQAAWDAIVSGVTEPWQKTIDTAGLDEAGKAIYELRAWYEEQEEAIAAIAATDADEDIDALQDTLGTAIRIMWQDLVAEFTDPWREIAETAGLAETALAVRDLNKWYEEQQEILASLIAADADGTDAAALTADLEAAYEAQLQALRDSLTEPWTEIIDTAGINDMAQAMYDLNKWFDEQAASAKELGLSIDDLTAAFDAQLGVLREQLTDPWQTIVDTAGMDDEQKELYELDKWYDTEKERALALGLDTTLLDQAYDILYDGITDVFGKAVEEYKDQLDGLNDTLDTVRNTIDAIGNTSDSIKYSSLNVALPTEIFSEADQDYDTLFASAQTGDADAIQDFLDFTSTYLGYAQDIYKSSQDYIDIYNDVMGDIGGLLTDQETEESRIVSAIGTMTTAIERIEAAIENQEISITVNVIDEDGNEVPVDISKQTTEGGKRNVTVQLAAA